MPYLFFTGHIPSSLGVILRTTDKIVWANEFERKFREDHSNLFSQSSFSFADLGCILLLSRFLFFFTAIELTCLIESISTNNPRIEWKKIKNGVPSYVYFQNKIAGKPLGNFLFFFFFLNNINHVDPSILKWWLRTQSSMEWMVPWKNLALSSVFLNSEVRWCVCVWMSNCEQKSVFFPLSFIRGLGAQSSAQRASQHPNLQHHSVRHCWVPLRGGRHRWSKGLWWDTY